MKCVICRSPAQGVVIFQKEAKTNTGYLVLDNKVSFDSQDLSRFLYYCTSKGLVLKRRGVVDLCSDCLRDARSGMN